MNEIQIGLFQLRHAVEKSGCLGLYSGNLVAAEEIKVGASYFTPSGMGGVFQLICTEVVDSVASFKTTCRDFPYIYKLELLEKDLDDDEFHRCIEIVKRYQGWSVPELSKEEHVLLAKSVRWGWVGKASFTQVYITPRTVERLKGAA